MSAEKTEWLLLALRAESLRLKSMQFEIDAIGIALKNGACSIDEAICWLRESSLLNIRIEAAVSKGWKDEEAPKG